MLKRSLLLVILALAAVFAVACDDSTEEGMAIFGVSDVNGGNAVTSIGGAGATVPMTFRWRPYFDTTGSITEAYPHGDYVIKQYRVTWTAVTAGAALPSPREQLTNIFVPVYELVTNAIIVATPAEATTVGSGNVMTANIEFTANEMGTDKEAKFQISVSVTFN